MEVKSTLNYWTASGSGIDKVADRKAFLKSLPVEELAMSKLSQWASRGVTAQSPLPKGVERLEDEFGSWYRLLNVKFTGDIVADMAKLFRHRDLCDWLYSNLGPYEYIEDVDGVGHAGADIQDCLR